MHHLTYVESEKLKSIEAESRTVVTRVGRWGNGEMMVKGDKLQL